MESEATTILSAETASFTTDLAASTLAAEATESDTVLDEPVVTAAIDETTFRNEWAERIREEKRLPAGLRDRLATMVAEATSEVASDEEPRLTVSQVANLFAEALPSFLAAPPRVAEHPQGERFFQGEAVTTEEAATIARRQLERTGFQREG